MMTESQQRDTIVEVGRRIYQKGMVAANDGNISVRLDADRLLVTPTGLSKGFMRSEEMAIVDADGRQISGGKPSSELPLHLHIYRKREDVQAVVHAHPPYATGFATAGIPLDKCVLAEVIVTIGSIPLAPYGTPSTEELPRSIDPFIESCDAFLLANHGVVTVGQDLRDATFKMERVEHYAHILFVARLLGGEKALTGEAVEKLYDLRQQYGGGDPNSGCRIEAQADDCVCSPEADDMDETEFETLVQKVLSAVQEKINNT